MLITDLPDEVLLLISEYLSIPVDFSGLYIDRPNFEHDVMNVHTKNLDSTLHLNAIHFLTLSSTCRKLRQLFSPIIFGEACGAFQTQVQEKMFLTEGANIGIWRSSILNHVTIFEPRIIENAHNRAEQRVLFDLIAPITLPSLKRLILELSKLNLDRMLASGNRHGGNSFWDTWNIKITASAQLDMCSISDLANQENVETKLQILQKIDRFTVMFPPLSSNPNQISSDLQLLRDGVNSLEYLSIALPFEIYTKVFEKTRALVRDTILSLIINNSSTISCLNIENLSYSWDLSRIQEHNFQVLRKLICKDTHLGLFSIFPSFSGSLVISSPSLNSLEKLVIPPKLTALTSFRFNKQSELYRKFSKSFKPVNFIKFFKTLREQNPRLEDVIFASLSVAELHNLTPVFIRSMKKFQLNKIDWTISGSSVKTWPATVTKTGSLKDEALEMPINKLMALLADKNHAKNDKCRLEKLKLPLNYHELISFQQLTKLATAVPGLKQIEVTLQWPRVFHNLSEEALTRRNDYLYFDSELEWRIVTPHDSYPHPQKVDYLNFLFIHAEKSLALQEFCVLGRQFESLAMEQLTQTYPGKYDYVASIQGDFLPSMVVLDLDKLRILLSNRTIKL